jgi:hypothetical protein
MANLQGFWSYVHADDQAEGARISRLAKDVAAQFEMLTGEPLALFLDKDAIKWGEEWRDKTDSSLSSVAFFIPALTPRFFMSVECRRELQFVARKATSLGIKGLILLLLYVDVPALQSEATTPGFLDQLATAEETMPKLTQTIVAIGEDLQLIGKLAGEASTEIKRGDKQAPGFAARLLVARQLARQLADPIERVSSLSNEFASQLHDVDEGYRVLIERAAAEAQQDAESKTAVCVLFNAIRSMNANAHSGLGAIQGLITAVAPAEKMSRDLRPILRRLREALTRMVEAGEVMDEWVQLVDGSGVACENGAVEAK